MAAVAVGAARMVISGVSVKNEPFATLTIDREVFQLVDNGQGGRSTLGGKVGWWVILDSELGNEDQLPGSVSLSFCRVDAANV